MNNKQLLFRYFKFGTVAIFVGCIVDICKVLNKINSQHANDWKPFQ